MRFYTPEEAYAKKQLRKKLFYVGTFMVVAVLSGLVTILANTAF